MFCSSSSAVLYGKYVVRYASLAAVSVFDVVQCCRKVKVRKKQKILSSLYCVIFYIRNCNLN